MVALNGDLTLVMSAVYMISTPSTIEEVFSLIDLMGDLGYSKRPLSWYVGGLIGGINYQPPTSVLGGDLLG